MIWWNSVNGSWKCYLNKDIVSSREIILLCLVLVFQAFALTIVNTAFDLRKRIFFKESFYLLWCLYTGNWQKLTEHQPIRRKVTLYQPIAKQVWFGDILGRHSKIFKYKLFIQISTLNFAQHITKPNLFDYWLMQNYLPSYWLANTNRSGRLVFCYNKNLLDLDQIVISHPFLEGLDRFHKWPTVE